MGLRWSLELGDSKSPFDCETCTEKDVDNRNCENHKRLPEDILAIEDYTEEQNEYLKEHKLKKVIPLGGGSRYIRLYECPVTYITDETRDIITLLYTMESTNHLLFEGGLSEQPYWLVQAMEIFKTELYYSREKTKDKNGKA